MPKVPDLKLKTKHKSSLKILDAILIPNSTGVQQRACGKGKMVSMGVLPLNNQIVSQGSDAQAFHQRGHPRILNIPKR